LLNSLLKLKAQTDLTHKSNTPYVWSPTLDVIIWCYTTCWI